MSYEAALVALLDPATSSRVYRMRLPENATLPAQTYSRVSTDHDYVHEGDTGLETVRVQVDCWANDPDAADATAVAGPLALSGYSDDFFQMIEVVNDLELDEADTGIYRRVVDLMLTYSEA